MKKLILLVFAVSIMLSGIAQAGVVPDGFVGIPWGANTEQIIKAMNERGYKQYTGTPPSTLAFNGDFSGMGCKDLVFHLINNSFYWGAAERCSDMPYPPAPQDAYRRIVAMLSEKYGPPQTKDRTSTDNNGKVHPEWVAVWKLIDSKTSDAYEIWVLFFLTWFNNDTKDHYIVNITYRAEGLERRLKQKEY